MSSPSSESTSFIQVQPTSSDTTRSSPAPVEQGTRIEVKRIDKAVVGGKWKLCESAPDAFETGEGRFSRYDEYADYAVILERKVENVQGSDIPRVTMKVLIQNDALLRVVRDVMKDVRKISWNVKPFKIDPLLLLAFLPQFRKYLAGRLSESVSGNESEITEPLALMIKLLETECAKELREIDSLVSNGEITFGLLWAILLPQSVLFTLCKTTSEPRAVRLREISLKKPRWGEPHYWDLVCEYIDEKVGFSSPDEKFGLATLNLTIPEFDGVLKITELSAYPFERHTRHHEVREKLIERGRNWVNLNGVHHLHYGGMAYRLEEDRTSHTKVTVNGRIMIDRHLFTDKNPNYEHPPKRKTFFDEMFDPFNFDVSQVNASAIKKQGLKDNDLLLTSPILCGFSLVEKRWLEFNVENAREIRWNDQVFENLALDADRKVLVRSLVESHAKAKSLDDFVEGKGLGLVFNLFGPPGVGKSLTVEATSEHLHKPIYIVSAGDLGTDAPTLDSKLTHIFSVAAKWDAIVLIDEADVFLEERGNANLERNAMVAVFLRQIEYFRGILFLTTNRVQTFDPAFQSRIHLSLHYKDLSAAAKEQIWRAFLDKARTSSFGVNDVTTEEMRELSEKNINGRQIKNVVKLAAALANHDGKPLGFSHIMRTMGVMGFSVTQ